MCGAQRLVVRYSAVFYWRGLTADAADLIRQGSMRKATRVQLHVFTTDPSNSSHIHSAQNPYRKKATGTTENGKILPKGAENGAQMTPQAAIVTRPKCVSRVGHSHFRHALGVLKCLFCFDFSCISEA